MTSKRSEGKEDEDFQGGVYEAAVNKEKQDDLRAHRELGAGGEASEEADSSSEPEEVSVAALNVRATAAGMVAAEVVIQPLIFQKVFHFRGVSGCGGSK